MSRAAYAKNRLTSSSVYTDNLGVEGEGGGLKLGEVSRVDQNPPQWPGGVVRLKKCGMCVWDMFLGHPSSSLLSDAAGVGRVCKHSRTQSNNT